MDGLLTMHINIFSIDVYYEYPSTLASSNFNMIMDIFGQLHFKFPLAFIVSYICPSDVFVIGKCNMTLLQSFVHLKVTSSRCFHLLFLTTCMFFVETTFVQKYEQEMVIQNTKLTSFYRRDINVFSCIKKMSVSNSFTLHTFPYLLNMMIS